MGNQLQKEYNIKQKPLKLPGSYNFLKFINHPNDELSLIIVKNPHKATMMDSTLILPIKQIKNLSQSSDTIAVCQRCTPLALFKPRSEAQMKIIMYKILKASTEIGRCFLYGGRVMLWCEQKRGISSMSPEEFQHGKFSEKSRVFISGMSLINFLFCVYQSQKENKSEGRTKKKDSSIKIQTKDKSKQQSEALPIEIKLFFQPKDKKQYFQILNGIDIKLAGTYFWNLISQGLRQLLLNMISQDPSKRINLAMILNIPYFMESLQMRLYHTLSDDIETMSEREARIFMKMLEMIIHQGLTIQKIVMENYFMPVLNSMVTLNRMQKNEKDYLLPLTVSILIQLDKPPQDVISFAFKKSHNKNFKLFQLALEKKQKLHSILEDDAYEFLISRAIFCSFESQNQFELVISSIPFAMRTIKQINLKKEIQFLLISKVLMANITKNNEDVLVLGLKCMIHLLKEKLISSVQKLQGVKYFPLKLSVQSNLHILYLYGLMIELFSPKDLISIMLSKLDVFLSQPQVFDQVFIVAKRCVDRILERLYQQRKLNYSQGIVLEKGQNYFQMQQYALKKPQNQEIKAQIKKQIEKHDLDSLKWVLQMI